jgi:hypothetical protein
LFITNTLKEGGNHASLLCEMPHQERNEEPQSHYYEEWQTGNTGRLPGLRHQDVQNRQELKPVAIFQKLELYTGLDIFCKGMSSPLLFWCGMTG